MSLVDALRLSLAWAWFEGNRVGRRAQEWLLQSLFASRGKNLRFDPNGYYSFENVSVGDDVALGRGAVLMASGSRILIGNKVMLGPEVMIVAGNHNTAVLGRAMADVKRKRPEDDEDIIIEDDVWVGARAIILKGVIVRRGAIVGAGSVVTQEVPPYAIVCGNPAKVIRFRWTVDEILEHEKELYPAGKPLSRESLQRIQNAWTPALLDS